ncbi:hypothetical protein AN189_12300 [Loktanella sp. 3ANDIMAR09]|uniref:hypothetical protein n=1 Tax=Loktanella sp. 3ANDIMAR09 TaxID=1225657 RepID=UPI0006FD89DF|nr:hypothetical protein [Loktanella sp. 3ANDIMAR09]KQI68168.1 hypothetical protein AN189_12300 [Loktanella sp. 3ANDIMAR09]
MTAAVMIENDVWDRHMRRILYSEAALLRADYGFGVFGAWVTSDELHSLGMSDLPSEPIAFDELAVDLGIERRWRNVSAVRVREYNALSFPWSLFGEFIAALRAETLDPYDATPGSSAQLRPSEVTPQWVLPLARLIRRGEAANADQAWNILDAILPDHAHRPTIEEVRRYMSRD